MHYYVIHRGHVETPMDVIVSSEKGYTPGEFRSMCDEAVNVGVDLRDVLIYLRNTYNLKVVKISGMYKING